MIRLLGFSTSSCLSRSYASLPPQHPFSPSPVVVHPFHAVLEFRLRSHVLVKPPPADLHVVVRRLQLRPVVNRGQTQNREHLLALIGLCFNGPELDYLEGVTVRGGVNLVAAEQVTKIQHLRLITRFIITFAKMHPMAHMSTAGP